mgnify:FL=1
MIYYLDSVHKLTNAISKTDSIDIIKKTELAIELFS